MLADISQHKYLNYCQDKGYLYGITLESVHRIISDGLIPILDVETPVSFLKKNFLQHNSSVKIMETLLLLLSFCASSDISSILNDFRC